MHVPLALLMLGMSGSKQVVAQAERHFRGALAAYAANPHALWHLGQVLVHQGNVAAGKERLRKGLAALAAAGACERARWCSVSINRMSGWQTMQPPSRCGVHRRRHCASGIDQRVCERPFFYIPRGSLTAEFFAYLF